jgi:hypothetical protein
MFKSLLFFPIKLIKHTFCFFKKKLLFSCKFSYYLLVFSFFSIFKIRKNEMEEKDRKHNNKDQIYSFELIRTN